MNTEFWNARYAEPGYAYGTEPNAFLVSQQARLRPGMAALAVADGEGRNGVWLAEQGLVVTSVDASAVGLRKAAALAAERGVPLQTVQADLANWDWPVAAFDLVVSVYAHFPPGLRPRLHRSMAAALRPGGVVLLEAFTPNQLQHTSGGPKTPEMLYTAQQLREDFASPDSEILLLEERLTELCEGPYHHGSAAVVRLVLQRRA